MTNTQRSDELSASPDSLSAARPIGLHITGKGFLLEGRFDHWMPVAVIEGGPDVGVVQLLCDSTAPANDTEAAREDELFSFSAGSLRKTGAQAYTTDGTLRAGGVEQDAEVVVQIPQGHSPFFFVTMTIDRARFPDLWEHLEHKTMLPLGDQKEMRPVAWLRPPTLASA